MVKRQVKLYNLPVVLQSARVLENSDSVSGFYGSYRNFVLSNYAGQNARQTLLRFSSCDGEVTGSNPFMLIALQESGALSGSRLTTRENLEKALKFNLDLRGNYVDFGIALREGGVSDERNETSAINLISQLSDRKVELGRGKLIPYSALTIKEDANSGYGLTLALKDSAPLDSLKELNDFRWDCNGSEGIARACLSWGGNWASNKADLEDTNDTGRVVVINTDYSK